MTQNIKNRTMIVMDHEEAARLLEAMEAYKNCEALGRIIGKLQDEVTVLKKELSVKAAELKDAQEHNASLVEKVDNQAYTIRKMSEEAAKAAKDTEILDWMDANVGRDKKAKGVGINDQLSATLVIEAHETYREAVRVAMGDSMRHA